MTEQRKLWFCQCHGHALMVEYWPDDGDESILNLAMWERSPGFKAGWRDRIRHIWQILWHGTPWADDLILSKADVKELVKFLMEIGNSSNSLEKQDSS